MAPRTRIRFARRIIKLLLWFPHGGEVKSTPFSLSIDFRTLCKLWVSNFQEPPGDAHPKEPLRDLKFRHRGDHSGHVPIALLATLLKAKYGLASS